MLRPLPGTLYLVLGIYIIGLVHSHVLIQFVVLYLLVPGLFIR